MRASHATERVGKKTGCADVPRPPPRWRRWFSRWNSFGLLLLIGAIGNSLWRVNQTSTALYSDDVVVVRVAHWQLELGYRDALQSTIDAYNCLQADRFARGVTPKRVQVVQLPVSEKTYGQLINTHLIAHTAPDLIEMGMTSRVSGAYRAEYFMNLSSEVEKPNPYDSASSKNTDGNGGPAVAHPSRRWRETFIDGMSGGFDRDLQGYYSVPTTFTPDNRLAVDLDLLQEATGSDHVPETLSAMLAACEAMRALGKRQGRDVWPIAGCSYSRGFWMHYVTPFLAESQRGLDADLDGTVGMAEILTAVKDGRWSFGDPAVGDLVAAARAVAAQFPNGFTAMDREAAMLLFTQRKSGFLFCGSWDVSTVYRLVGNKFRIALMPNVLPGPGERWGAKLPVNEATVKAGGSFGVFKLSPHIDVALDFLHFWTNQAENQRFNQQAEWVPCIIGCKVSEHMAAFVPSSAGLSNESAWLPLGDSGQISEVFLGQMGGVLTGEVDHAKLARRLRDIAGDPQYGIEAVFKRMDEDAVDRDRTAERGIAAQALGQLLLPASAAPPEAYRSLVSTQADDLNGEASRALRRCAEKSPR